MGLIMSLSWMVAAVNVLLIAGLLYVYGSNFLKLRSSFTLGLFVFSFLFLVHNALYLYFAITMMPYYSMEGQVYGFVFNLFQAAAFSVLNIVTWR